jgi:hypothetical protein
MGSLLAAVSSPTTFSHQGLTMSAFTQNQAWDNNDDADDDDDDDDDDDTCHDAPSVWPAVIAAGSALLLGYYAGRVSYSRDLRDAFRRIEESPETIEVSIRTL